MTALGLALALALPSAALFGRAGSVETQTKHFAEGRYRDVVRELPPETLQKLRGRPLREGYLLLAKSHEMLDEPHKAMSLYQVAVRLFPNDINLLTAAAELLQRMGLEDRAEPLFQKVLRIHPNNGAAHLGLAGIERTLGFLDSSAGHFEKALEQYGDSAQVWRDYAETLYQMRDYATAEPAVRKALQLQDEADGRLLLAHVLRAANRLDQALETIESVVGERPSAAAVRALWLLEARRYPEAQQAAEGALKAGVSVPLARYIRARCELKADRYNAAIEDLEAAARLEREAPFVARMATEMLARLRGRK